MIEDPTFWDAPIKAQGFMRERTKIGDAVEAVDEITNDLRDNVELLELGVSEEDVDIIHEAERAIQELTRSCLRRRLKWLL